MAARELTRRLLGLFRKRAPHTDHVVLMDGDRVEVRIHTDYGDGEERWQMRRMSPAEFHRIDLSDPKGLADHWRAQHIRLTRPRRVHLAQAHQRGVSRERRPSTTRRVRRARARSPGRPGDDPPEPADLAAAPLRGAV